MSTGKETKTNHHTKPSRNAKIVRISIQTALLAIGTIPIILLFVLPMKPILLYTFIYIILGIIAAAVRKPTTRPTNTP